MYRLPIVRGRKRLILNVFTVQVFFSSFSFFFSSRLLPLSITILFSYYLPRCLEITNSERVGNLISRIWNNNGYTLNLYEVTSFNTFLPYNGACNRVSDIPQIYRTIWLHIVAAAYCRPKYCRVNNLLQRNIRRSAFNQKKWNGEWKTYFIHNSAGSRQVYQSFEGKMNQF